MLRVTIGLLLCGFLEHSASFSWNLPQPVVGRSLRVPQHGTCGLALAKRTAKCRAKMVAGVPLDSSQFDRGDANPIDSMETLDKLVPRAKITELVKQTSDVEGMLQVAWHVGWYALGAVVAFVGETMNLRPLLFLGVLWMSFVTSFNFMALHETVHRSAFKTRLLNDMIMHIAGFLCLRPAVHYFYYHWGHHKYTGNPEKDSELQPSALDMDVSTIPGYFLYISGLPFWFDAITTTISHALGRAQPHEQYLTSDKAKAEVFSEARIYALLYTSILVLGLSLPSTLGSFLLKFWVIPSVLGQPMLRFYLFAEHRGCKEGPNVMENTRGMSTNGFYRKMAWQMPYHLEHHAWPYVPFHKLPQAHALVQAAGGQVKACDPPGEHGYVRLNLSFLRRLWPRRGDTAPSGAA